MPLYEYKCQSCGRRIERIRKFSDPPLTECPHCGGTLEKLISSPAFQFKGSGWYVTDYARKSEKSDAAKSGGETKNETSGAKDAGDAAKPSGDSPAPATKDAGSSGPSTSSKKD